MPLALILVRWLHLSTSILLASLFLFETAVVVPAARKPSAGIEQLLGRDLPPNLSDCNMDASRGAHVVVRLELARRFNNDRRRLN
jgi:hypothetical protein